MQQSRLSGKTDLSDFVMEAQADLLADYCMYINGLYKVKFTTWPQRVQNEIKLYGDSRYHKVLKIIKKHKDKTLFPKKRI